MLKTVKYFFVLLCLVCNPAVTKAKILCVPYGYQTIQNAVDAAQSGDVILVKPGIYIENISIDGKGITLRSDGDCDYKTYDIAPEATKIISPVYANVIICSNVTEAEVILDGFRITQGAPGIQNYNAKTTVKNCIIDFNFSGGGAGLSIIAGATATITNCVIANNQASMYAGMEIFNATVTISNCSIINNNAVEIIGGMYAENSSLTLINSIVWANTAETGPALALGENSNATITYCNLQGGKENVAVASGANLQWVDTTNIDADPLFAFSDDYHLTSESPCIDTGTSENAPATDIDGDARPGGRGVDIGADEYAASSPPVTTIPQQTRNSKAIIVAGGGPFTGNSLWDSTSMLAGYAYKTLLFQGFTADTIFYLTADSQTDIEPDGSADADAEVTGENLHYAITQWAVSAEDVIIYLTDHGGSGIFRMSETETLTATQLDSWLDELQEAIPGKLIFVYDACQSGSFLPLVIPPAGKKRIVIAGSSAQEPAYFITEGTVSFSRYFWSNIFNGDRLYRAFTLAQDAMLMAGYQTPLLDDNGNGIGNEKDDGAMADPYVIGMGKVKGEDIPVILSISGEQTLKGTTSAEIWADDIVSSSTIVMVWALIKGPNQNPDDPANAVTALPSIVLTQAGDGKHKGTYSEFTAPGSYTISIYAMDEKANISLPKTTKVTQTSGSSSICPAVLLAGGENETTSLFRAFRDNVLSKTPQGRQYIKLFYQHAPETAAILLQHPRILSLAGSALRNIIPALESSLKGKDFNLTQSMLCQVEQTLDSIGSRARPELKKAMYALKEDLAQGKISGIIQKQLTYRRLLL